MAKKELYFKIQEWDPHTLPMARLAEYLQHLAILLGSEKSVHFKEVDEGSAKCAMEVDEAEQPRITHRVQEATKGIGNKEAQLAANFIFSLLQEDHSGAELEWDDGTVILDFSRHRQEEQETFGPFWQEGTLDGFLVKVGGYDETVPVHILHQGSHTICNTTQQIAKQLGHHLYENVRLFGRGRWYRNSDAQWELQKFDVSSFQVLSSDSLLDVVAQLRTIPNDLVNSDDPIGLMERIRHGESKK